MSLLPILKSFLFLAGLLSLMLWKLNGVFGFVIVLACLVSFLVKEVFTSRVRFVLGFWLFVFSEVAIFLTLFFVCLWYQENDNIAISDGLELPFLGCFFLMGSSITVTTFHHVVGCEKLGVNTPISMVGSLLLTIFLGACFIGLQMVEFFDSGCDLLYLTYYASCFSVVGLHFSHVLLGLVGLTSLLFLGPVSLSRFHLDVLVWYWHFVDYIWLLVYIVVYLA